MLNRLDCGGIVALALSWTGMSGSLAGVEALTGLTDGMKLIGGSAGPL